MKLPIERLLNKVKKTESCWIWIGAKKPTGYGNFFLNGKYIGAHCASYLLHVGEIDKGQIVCHSCDNPSCINPCHLFLGTPKDNMDDMKLKGRAVGIHQGKENHPMSKLSIESVREIRQRRLNGEFLLPIAKDYGVTESNIFYVCKNKTWVDAA